MGQKTLKSQGETKLQDNTHHCIHRCLKIGGKAVLDRWLESQEELLQCFMEEFQVFTIQAEIEESKKKGELELVFQKYCR